MTSLGNLMPSLFPRIRRKREGWGMAGFYIHGSLTERDRKKKIEGADMGGSREGGMPLWKTGWISCVQTLSPITPSLVCGMAVRETRWARTVLLIGCMGETHYQHTLALLFPNSFLLVGTIKSNQIILNIFRS